MNFSQEYFREIVSSLSNDYDDNWDDVRYGKLQPEYKPANFSGKLKNRFKRLLNRRGYYNIHAISGVVTNSSDVARFEYLFDHLEADDDRKLLIRLLAYRVLGHRKVKLPLNSAEYWSKLKYLENLSDKSDSLNPNFLNFSLNRIKLDKIGYPIDFYFTEHGVLINFVIKQYEYNKNGVVIKADPGDIVIDGGGCWGDTALYFANEVGNSGKVYSFEFIPNNINIFEKNVALNPHLKNRIALVRRPIWKDAETKIYYKDNGPGSNVSLDELKDADGEVYTQSIDDLVAEKALNTVDFIKLDIEGAEMNALTGAAETIKKFKPKLAIALYHSVGDYERLPRMIKELVPGYKFYFSHCTIHKEESILFANVDDSSK